MLVHVWCICVIVWLHSVHLQSLLRIAVTHPHKLVNEWRPMITSSHGSIFPRHWPFVREIHRSQMNSPHTSVARSFDVFLICARTNGWVHNPDADDLRPHRVHYYVILMQISLSWYRHCENVPECIPSAGLQLLNCIMLSSCIIQNHVGCTGIYLVMKATRSWRLKQIEINTLMKIYGGRHAHLSTTVSNKTHYCSWSCREWIV